MCPKQSAMTSSDETIFARFSDCPLEFFQGVSTYQYLAKPNTYNNSCSTTVHINGRCEYMGYLVLTVSPVVYTLQSVVAFVVPENPRATLAVPDPATTAAVLGKLTHQCTEDLRIFKEYTKIDKAYNKIITKLVPDIYFRTLKK